MEKYKSMKTNVKLLFTLFALLLLYNCKKDDVTKEDIVDITSELNEYIAALSNVPQNDISEADSTESSDVTFDQDSIIYTCRTTVIKKAPGYNELLFAQTYRDALYPGALLNGQSVIDGTYTLCNLPRKPVTITVDLPLDGDVSKTIEDPKYSTIQTEINKTLAQDLTGSAGAEVNYTIHSVNTEAQLKAEIGLNCSLKGIFEIGGNVNFSSGLEYNRVVVRFCQNYYNIIVDQPTDPMKFIDNADLSDRQVIEKIGDYAPMYVSSVTYGRMALIYFESTDLSLNLEAGVKASFPIMVDGGNINLGGEGSFGAKFKRGEITCKAFILGGSGENAVKSLTTPDAIYDFIKNGGEYSNTSPGKPISYNLRYLANNDPVKVVMNSEYTSTVCSKVNMANCNYRITTNSTQANGAVPLYHARGDLYFKAGKDNTSIPLVHFNFPYGIWPHYGVGYVNGVAKTDGTVTEYDFGRLTEAEMKTYYFEWISSDLRFGPNVAGVVVWGEVRPISTKVYLNELVINTQQNIKLDLGDGSSFFINYTATMID